MAVNNYIDNTKLYNTFVEYLKLCRLSKKAKELLPRIPDYIGESFLLIANHLSMRPNFCNYCVDKDTEALTQRGWLRYNEITLDDIMLSYDIKTNKLVWSKVIDVFINKKYKGLMHKLDVQGLDALVSPYHKFVSKENGLKEVERFKCKEHLILMGDAVEYNKNLIYYDDFVKLVGWSVTEGNYRVGKNKHSIHISQNVNTTEEKEIENCIKNITTEYSSGLMNENKIRYFNIKGEIASKIIKLAPNRVLSMEFILNLTKKQRILLIDTMVKGDGWNERHYCQKDKYHIDSFVALCTIAGFTTGTHYIEQETAFGLFKGYVVNIYKTPKKVCFVENIDFHGGRPKAGGNWRLEKFNTPMINYSGVIWCPKTEYGTFVCRRGKYVYVTGNTFKDEMISDGIENCILYLRNFNPKKSKNPFAYFTQIMKWAFIRRIEKEKKQMYIKYKSIQNSSLYDDLVIHDDQDESGMNVPSYIDLSNKKMETLIFDFEDKMKKKKADVKRKKRKKAKMLTVENFLK